MVRLCSCLLLLILSVAQSFVFNVGPSTALLMPHATGQTYRSVKGRRTGVITARRSSGQKSRRFSSRVQGEKEEALTRQQQNVAGRKANAAGRKAKGRALQRHTPHSSLRAAQTLRGGILAPAEIGKVLLDGALAVLAGIPGSFFVKGLGLSLVLSSHGFVNREHFVSYGYGFSMAAQAGLALFLFKDSLHPLSLTMALGVLAYGLRLAIFCGWRDRQDSFQEVKNRMSKPKDPSAPLPFFFWALVSSLYALLFLPVLFALKQAPAAWAGGKNSILCGMSTAGVGVMWLGLLLEAISDYQKSIFKRTNPKSPITSGLFRLCRHPNYLGEDIFWGGVWLSGAAAYGAVWWRWVLSALGTVQIFSIISMATGGLEKRQAAKYGGSKQYDKWISRTPSFIPFFGSKSPPPS